VARGRQQTGEIDPFSFNAVSALRFQFDETLGFAANRPIDLKWQPSSSGASSSHAQTQTGVADALFESSWLESQSTDAESARGGDSWLDAVVDKDLVDMLASDVIPRAIVAADAR
jgi:hypothetical protein